MPTFKSFAAYGNELNGLIRDVERESRKSIAMAMAEAAQPIARQEAVRDVGGDVKFSGWAPKLDTQVKSVRSGAIIMPTRSSAGPWTVAQQGRNQGNASGFSGPGINRRTGRTSRNKSGAVRKVRRFRARRWNGRTIGKGTADRATRRMNAELEPIAGKQTRRIIQRRFDVT